MLKPPIKVLATASLAVAVTAAIALPATADQSPPAPPSPPSPAALALARATSAAGSLVAGRPARLHAGPDDAFVQRPAVAAAGWQYVPYERTYRGLPVIGGDFVVVVDPAGQVSSTSVAQPAPIANLDTHPLLTQGAAEHIAAGQLAAVTGVTGTHLVVDAMGTTPKLAWESTVAGRGPDGASALTVDVDAVAGTVLRTQDGVLHDIGHAALNGNLVNVADALLNCPSGNCPDQHTWILAYPSGGGLQCDAPTVHRTDPEPLVWGNGDPTNAETACVDAMFDSDAENAMLVNWLGRNGLDGNGPNDGWPIFTDSSIISNTEFAIPSPVTQFELFIGHSPNGVWWASLDTVGHENGHGIDASTPGGLSNGGTGEFIADAFGVATEWYANEAPPYDTPDYVLADNPVMQTSQSDKRFMYDPHLNGSGVNCYSGSIGSISAHDAAGIGDHWLYLAAEGSSPTDGQPTSPTCNGAAVRGVGLQRAMQILYHAMLMKNSSSSYPNYRLWTLTAANNLFPGDCATLDAVRTAWDAVSVPVQPGEPSTCVPNVVGSSQSAATSTITAAGLVVGTITQRASNSPIGTVLAQSPVPGTIRTEGGVVNLTVAAFAVAVPDVVGKLRNDAVNIIRAAGLSPGVISVKTCENPQAVIRQSPVGGTGALPGGPVQLTVDIGTIKTC